MPDASETELVAFLGRYSGVPFCADCLAHEVGIRRERIEDWVRSLDNVDIATERRWCVRCFRKVDTVRIHPRIERSAG